MSSELNMIAVLPRVVGYLSTRKPKVADRLSRCRLMTDDNHDPFVITVLCPTLSDAEVLKSEFDWIWEAVHEVTGLEAANFELEVRPHRRVPEARP